MMQMNIRPSYARDSILMRGNNMSAVHWVNQGQAGKEPRSGALISILGCLEMGSRWYFDALHVKGVDNTVADGISRWKREEVNTHLCGFRHDVVWTEQVGVGSSGRRALFGSIGSKYIRDSITQLSCKAYESGFRSWTTFRGLINADPYFLFSGRRISG